VRESEALLRSPDWRLAAALGYLLFDVALLGACFEAFGWSPSLGTVLVG
jgi:hypothetical protein